jgi:hypothetical protein
MYHLVLLTLMAVLSSAFAFSISFENKSPNIVNIYWQSSEAQVRMGEIDPGKKLRLDTYPGHIFVAKDASTMEQLGAWLMESKVTHIDIAGADEGCGDERATQALNNLLRKKTHEEKAAVSSPGTEPEARVISVMFCAIVSLCVRLIVKTMKYVASI